MSAPTVPASTDDAPGGTAERPDRLASKQWEQPDSDRKMTLLRSPSQPSATHGAAPENWAGSSPKQPESCAARRSAFSSPIALRAVPANVRPRSDASNRKPA